MVFINLARNLWETTKPTTVLTDNESVTNFFPNKSSSISVEEGMCLCVYVLQIIFKTAHIAGSGNTEADLLSTLELRVTERICLKIREEMQTTPIDLTKFSLDDADED